MSFVCNYQKAKVQKAKKKLSYMNVPLNGVVITRAKVAIPKIDNKYKTMKVAS